MAAREWIAIDESAKDFLSRTLSQRPPLLLPPLHRLPLRAGNVVEILGPSPSSKSLILLQVAIECILPKEWKGVCYGGLGHSVAFIDLDCCFDILRLLQLLKHRIVNLNGSSKGLKHEQPDAKDWSYDEELIETCLQRFLYVRCYDSLEFLSTLKTLHHRLERTRKELGSSVHFLMIDSIGAYYWVDRASASLPLGANSRKQISLQSITEAIVHEIQNLLQVHPVLILATKATIFSDKVAANYSERNRRKWSLEDTAGNAPGKILPREYMPSVWQSLITHRMSVRPSDTGQIHAGHDDIANEQVYLAEWVLPSLGFADKFVVRDGGIVMTT